MNISSKEYMLVNLPYIKNNKKHFKKYANLAYERFKFSYGDQSSTAFYRYTLKNKNLIRVDSNERVLNDVHHLF